MEQVIAFLNTYYLVIARFLFVIYAVIILIPVSYTHLDVYKRQVQKHGEKLPVTVNMMTFFKDLDYFKFAKLVDVISWDSYPNWHAQPDELKAATETAFMHDLMRSLKKAPFLLMESTPSITNWKPVNTQKRPGMHLLASLQAVAHLSLIHILF